MEEKVPAGDTNRYEQIETPGSNSGRNNRNGYILAGVIILLCIPVFYLFFNTKKNEAPVEAVTPAAPAEQNSVAALEQALEKAPTFQNFINLGVAYQQNGQAKRSIPLFQKAIELQPNSAVAYNDLGVGYILTRQFPDAEQALAKAIQLDPEFQLAKNNLAWMEQERKTFMDELQKLESIADADKTPQQFIDLGLKYYALGEYQKSVDAFTKCIEKDPSNSLAYNNMGTSYMFMKNYAEAKRSFEKAIGLNGAEQLYKNNLKWAEDEISKQGKAE